MAMNKASKRFALLLVLAATLAVSMAAGAAGVGAVRKQAESAMRVTGTIHTDAQGLVTGYALDEPEKLPPGVRTLVADAIPRWRFHPRQANGQPVPTSTDMSLLVVARKTEEGAFEVRLGSMAFGLREPTTEEQVRPLDLPPPAFPPDMLRAGVTGTVYLLLRVGRDGKVEDVIAEQVNLRVLDDERAMERMRRQFVQAALRGPANWRFVPPTRGPDADAAHWTVRVPVAFHIQGERTTRYGEWESYIRGPRTLAPWGGDALAQAPGFGPDALPGGGAFPADGGLKLLADGS